MSVTELATRSVMVPIPSDFEARAHGHMINAADLALMPAHSIGYLIASGFYRDVSARASRKRADRVADIKAGRASPMAERRIANEIATVERLVKRIASERIDKICEARGLRKPRSLVRRAAIERMIAEQYNDIYAEANARNASNASAAAQASSAIVTGPPTASDASAPSEAK